MNGKYPHYFLAEAILGFIYFKFYHRVNNRGKDADGFYNSMIDNKDGHTPSPLIMTTYTALRHALLEWHQNEGVHPKASKSKLKAHGPDRSNSFNSKNDSGKIASCCPAMGRKEFTSSGVVDTYPFLMNTSNTLPESYHQRAYQNPLATVKRQIQQAENPTPPTVISTEAARVDNCFLLDYLTSEVALAELQIGSTDQNILIDRNCTDDKLHFGMPRGCEDQDDEDDEIDETDAIPTPSRRRRAATELDRFDMGTYDVDGYEGDDGDDGDADEKEEASQDDHGLTQTEED
jgi:hypothetical protein